MAPTRRPRPAAARRRYDTRPTRVGVAVLAVLLATSMAALTGGDGAAADEVHLSIYNGEPASIEDLPYVVYVETATGTCTGSVIAPTWILTAAHCFEAADPAGVTVAIGGDSFSEGFDEVLQAARVVLHPDYGSTNTGDIALVELASATMAPAVALVPAGWGDPVGVTAIITGWGNLVTAPEPQATDVLMRALVPVVDDARCSEEYGSDYDPATYSCAGGQGRDVCSGDSGGPLVVTIQGVPTQLGLVAYGQTCGPDSSTIGAYTSVGAYRTWMATTMGTDPDPGPDPSPTGFPDVIAGTPHADSIARVAAARIAGGYTDGRFGPSDPVTRGQMATFLSRAMDLRDPGGQPFPDVPDDHPHAAGIRAVAAAEVAGGYRDRTYRPGERVTRGQMGTFLARALGLGDPGVRYFLDVLAADVHSPTIQAVAGQGVAGGYTDGTYRPGGPVTRAQMATFLDRAFLDGPRSQPPAAIPATLGALVDRCTGGSMADCDDLYRGSELGSLLEAYGDSCGYRQPAGSGVWCVEAFGAGG